MTKQLKEEFLLRYANKNKTKQGKKMLLLRHIEDKTQKAEIFMTILEALSKRTTDENYNETFNTVLQIYDIIFEDEIYSSDVIL